MSQNRRYISVKAAADLLGVACRTVRDWADDGKLCALNDDGITVVIERDCAVQLLRQMRAVEC